MIVKVTQQHIDSAGRHMYNCPLALALKDQGALDPYVASAYAWTTPEHRYKLSPRAQMFVERFDIHLPVKPTSFRLTYAPEQVSEI